MMKKALSVLCVFVLVCAVLTGCGLLGGSKNGGEAVTSAPSADTTETTTVTTTTTTTTTTEDPDTTFPEDETRKIYPGLVKDPDGAYPYKLSTFSTYYDSSNVTRTANLKTAAKKINDIVVPAGGVFSFNQTVGKRTVTAGYREAKVIQSGEFVDGLGGGVCQVSSTVFRSVLLANVEIVERTCHSLEVTYVKLGGDATVQWNSKDFVFKNSLGTDLRLAMSCGDGVLTCTVYAKDDIDVGDVEVSISKDGDTYTLVRRVNGTKNYSTKSRYQKPKPTTTTKKKEESTTKKP